MINLTDAGIGNLIVHKVGNKLHDENIQFSKNEMNIEEEISNVLLDYFLSPFKTEQYYHFHHETDLALNEVYSCAAEFFEDKSTFINQSVQLANLLYEKSNHPKINKGEFYIVSLNNCFVNGEEVDAIGLFKSELRESFLKVYPTEDTFAIHCDEGINIKKLDKGCIIFNTEKENGFLVAMVDNLNKGTDAQYWKDEFLKITPRKDNFYHTQNIMSFCKSYVQEQLPEEYEITKAEQAIILNKSVQFLKEKEAFDFQEFANEVFEEPEIIQSVKDYRQDFEQQTNTQIHDEFDISSQAIKKQSRVMKSVIKLDKNFHIYVHGKRQYIQKGYDEEKGLNYYQIYFKEEN